MVTLGRAFREPLDEHQDSPDSGKPEHGRLPSYEHHEQHRPSIRRTYGRGAITGATTVAEVCRRVQVHRCSTVDLPDPDTHTC